MSSYTNVSNQVPASPAVPAASIVSNNSNPAPVDVSKMTTGQKVAVLMGVIGTLALIAGVAGAIIHGVNPDLLSVMNFPSGSALGITLGVTGAGLLTIVGSVVAYRRCRSQKIAVAAAALLAATLPALPSAAALAQSTPFPDSWDGGHDGY